MSHSVTITGVPLNGSPGFGQSVPARREIHDLIKDEKQFSLYVQAVASLMSVPQDDPRSWFQVGGIHGLPNSAWDGAQGDPQYGGYCTHASVLFPTWHRPYVALFEQMLQAHAMDIAKKYTTDQDLWVKAAQEFRSPYWDWARYDVPPNETIRDSTVHIVTPDGAKDFENPLLGYTFKPIDPSFEGPFASWQSTVRDPDADGDGTNVQSIIDSLRGFDGRLARQRRSAVHRMLIENGTWMGMSNKKSKHGMAINRGAANSLETLHDGIHGAVGGGGHMGNIDYAGFDPMFWLHHTNVDRLLSLWQAIHPQLWVIPADGNYPTFTIASGARVDENTDLAPFWNGPQSFHKSSAAAVRDTTGMNYTYPEFVGMAGKPVDEVRSKILDIVNEYYGASVHPVSVTQPSAGSAPVVNFAALAPSASVAAKVAPVKASQNIPPSGPQTALFAAGGSSQAPMSSTQENAPEGYTEWLVRIRSKRYALGGSYSVLIFIGEPPAAESEWRTSSALAGIHVEFANSHPETCANCSRDVNESSEGFIDITKRLELLHYLERPEREIEEYLKANLRWRIQKIDASVVSAEDLDGLEVSVMTIPLTYSPEFKSYMMQDDVRPSHRNITGDSAGGRNAV